MRGGGVVGRLYLPQGDRQQQCVFSRTQKQPQLTCRWQQFDTLCSLISAPQWPYTPCSGPMWFCRVGKRPPVKADLGIYSPMNGVYV